MLDITHVIIIMLDIPQQNPLKYGLSRIEIIVKSHNEEIIIVITWVWGGAEDECNNNGNLRVQWDLTGFYPIVFDLCHVTQ